MSNPPRLRDFPKGSAAPGFAFRASRPGDRGRPGGSGSGSPGEPSRVGGACGPIGAALNPYRKFSQRLESDPGVGAGYSGGSVLPLQCTLTWSPSKLTAKAMLGSGRCTLALVLTNQCRQPQSSGGKVQDTSTATGSIQGHLRASHSALAMAVAAALVIFGCLTVSLSPL